MMRHMKKRQQKQTRMVELPDRDFKITLTNVFKDLVETETTCVNIWGRQMRSIKKEPNGNTKNKNNKKI